MTEIGKIKKKKKKNRDMKLSSPSHTVAIAYGAPQHTVETVAVGWRDVLLIWEPLDWSNIDTYDCD